MFAERTAAKSRSANELAFTSFSSKFAVFKIAASKD